MTDVLSQEEIDNILDSWDNFTGISGPNTIDDVFNGFLERIRSCKEDIGFLNENVDPLTDPIMMDIYKKKSLDKLEDINDQLMGMIRDGSIDPKHYFYFLSLHLRLGLKLVNHFYDNPDDYTDKNQKDLKSRLKRLRDYLKNSVTILTIG